MVPVLPSQFDDGRKSAHTAAASRPKDKDKKTLDSQIQGVNVSGVNMLKLFTSNNTK
jgi:hypothetical protein